MKSILTLLMLFSLVSGCGTETQNSSTSNSPENIDNNSQDLPKNVAKAKPWRGSAAGYISDTNTSERIKIFIILGRVLAAADLYNQKSSNILSKHISANSSPSDADRADMASVFDPALLSSYAAIDSEVQAKLSETNQTLSVQEAINALIEPQQIADIVNPDRAVRDKQTAARDKVLSLLSRLYSAVLAFFPSRHEYLLASSALIREAGDKAAAGISADSIVLDTDLLLQVRSLIDKSDKLDPRDISYCDAQRIPMKEHKDAINEILNKLVPFELGAKLSATASDIYSLAEQAKVAGERFPIKNNSTCN